MASRKKTLWTALTALLGIGIYFGMLQFNGNLHNVVPNELYRAAQMSPQELERTIQQHGIKSVINLRGENPDTKWYPREVAATERNGAKHLNFRMSAKRMLTEEKAAQLVAMMRDAPKPLLIHCQAGADRSGIASALYLYNIKHESRELAYSQLSMVYGHLPFSFAAAYPMLLSFNELVPEDAPQTITK